jgi:hypothetical protein
MPFGGPTTSHTLVQIIEKETPAFPKVADTPPELQRIIRKAMAKNPDERYQSAKDLGVDLKSLRKQLDHRPERDTDFTDKEPDKKRVLGLALAAMAVVVVGFLGWSIWRAVQSRTTSSVVPAAPSPVVPGPERRLTYWITVQKFRDGEHKEPYTVAGEINFEARDQIRVNVRSPQRGYLYILNEGPRAGSTVPEFVFLFPTSSTNEGLSLLAADQQVVIPEKTWLQFDTQQGVEKLWLVFAEEAISELENVKGFASKQTKGLITDMTQNKLIHDFLTTRSTTKPELEKGDTLTTLKMPGKLLLYPVRLEHH